MNSVSNQFEGLKKELRSARGRRGVIRASAIVPPLRQMAWHTLQGSPLRWRVCCSAWMEYRVSCGGTHKSDTQTTGTRLCTPSPATYPVLARVMQAQPRLGQLADNDNLLICVRFLEPPQMIRAFLCGQLRPAAAGCGGRVAAAFCRCCCLWRLGVHHSIR